MAIDRLAQKHILEQLSAAYPNQVSTEQGERLGTDKAALYFHLAYLEEHGLVVCQWSRNISSSGKTCISAKITAKGLDFIAEDGGLSAVLGVVTIKIHDDTLRQLIAARIDQSDLAAPDKKRLTDRLRELPADAIKHLTLKLVDKGLERGPEAIAWLEKLMQSAA